MVAGVGLTALSGGALSPLMAGLITGGLTGAATGSLKKGLMAGLGAYGGAGIGGALAGVGATQAGNAAAAELAGTNANLAQTLGEGANAKDILMARGAQSAGPAMQALNANPAQMSMTDKMMAGVKGLGDEAGRDAFMQNIGGAQGLFKSGYAALSPVMMAQAGQSAQRPDDPPNRFEFDAGATGAIQRPGAGEVSYFRPRLRQMAEGGSTGMTGQSDEYYRYLMGLAPAPSPYAAPAAAPAATQADTAPLAITNPMAARRDVNYSDSMAFDDPNNPQNPNSWGNLTPLQQAAFYAQNPIAAKATQLMQEGFALTPMGKLQAAMVPDFVAQQQAIANPGPGGYLSSLDFALLGMSPPAGKQSSNQSLTGGLLNFSGTQPDAPVDIAVPTISNAQAAQMMADEINASLNASLNAPAAPAVPAAPGVVEGGPMDLSLPVGTNIGLIDANIGIDPSGMGGIDPGVAADVAAATAAGVDAGIDPGEFARGGLSSLAAFARGGYNRGGYNLGDYSDGGRLLRGPGDGVSDSIPASIGNKRPARLADGEFVVPARIVSELGNGSTEAGARKLYAMMNRVQKNRRKSIGRNKVAVNSRSDKYLPA
jgi:hypothetical protein